MAFYDRAMISPAYVATMAAYNAEMNRRLFSAAARLSDGERRQDRGAFWHSIHGTFNHLLWADLMWMSRFAGWPAPKVAMAQSCALHDSFEVLSRARFQADADLQTWALGVGVAWLAEDLVWFSGGAQREMRKPRALLLTHLFNHQTHHRGQAHALLTAAGQATGDTDLPHVLSQVVAS